MPTAFFENEVRPLLAKACQQCHGASKQRGSLRLDSRAALVRGGDSGPAVVPGEPAKSRLIRAVAHKDDAVPMPPKQKLSDDQIKVLTRWVELGVPWSGEAPPTAIRSGGITAKDREFWSFRPIRPPPIPQVRDAAWPASDIDRFILARLEAKGW